MYREFTIGIVAMIFGAVLITGCITSTLPAPTTPPKDVETNTLLSIFTITLTGADTPNPNSEENATPTLTPTGTQVAVTPEVTVEPYALIIEYKNLDWSQEISGIVGLENADVVMLKKYTLNIDNGDGTYDNLNLVVDGKKVYATTWKLNDGQNKDIKVMLTLSDLNLKQDFGGGYTKDFISTREDGTLWIIDPVTRQERPLRGLAIKPGGDGMMYLFESSGQSRLVVGVEIIKSAENENVVEGMVGVRDDLVFGGRAEVDIELGKQFYKDLFTSMLSNEQCGNYFRSFLGKDLSYENLMNYLKNNGYVMPVGLPLLYQDKPIYPKINESVTFLKPVLVDGLLNVQFDRNDWSNNVGGVREYLESLEGKQLVEPTGSAVFALMQDVMGRLVLVSGSKGGTVPYRANMDIGGMDGVFDPVRDLKIAAANIFTISKIYVKFNTNWTQCAEPMDRQCAYAVTEDDLGKYEDLYRQKLSN